MATSPALAWSLANGISQAEYDKSIVDAIKLGESKGLSDAQFESLMNQYQISAADVARATQSTPAIIQSRMEAATPTTATEIAYNQAAMDELAKREAQWAQQQKQNAIDWTKQQQTNTTNWAEQQRLNELKNAQQIAANQKAYEAYLASQAKLAADQASKATGFQTSAGTLPFANATQGFAQNFQNYQSIAPGAQYNPAVMPGGASPYSLIMGQMKPMGNPYAGVVAGQAMGGYNPGLYDQIAAANLAKTEAEKLANVNTILEGGGDGPSGPAGPTGGGGGGAMAKGGYVHGGLMFGANPPGPDDGAVNLDMGEYVIKKSSVNKYGRGLLDMINEGKVPAKKLKSLLG
jgi:flagellar motor protein MotB